jgi:uncharacterized membrane protein
MIIRSLKQMTAVFLAGSAMFITSCKHEPELPQNGIVDEICFETQVQPIINSNCAVSGCHDGSDGELPVLITYNNIMREVKANKPNDSKLMEVVTKNPGSEEFMPPSPRTPLTSAQIAIIETWILEGAKNTTCATTDCDSVNVTYSTTIAGIISTYCAGCHGSVSPSAGLTLTSYSQVVSAVNNKNLVDHVNQTNGYSPMPPSGIKLSQCSLAQLSKWISEGMPNN